MKKEELSFHGVGGLKIFYRTWLPEKTRGIMLLVHGLGEHSGRYDHVAERLGRSGWACFALDHRGHGRSEGKRGHIMKFSEFTDDANTLKEDLRRNFSGYPLIVLGHSLGGLIGARLCLDQGEGVAGYISSSAAYRFVSNEPKIKLAAGRFLSKYWPSLTLSNGLDPAGVSRDPAVVRAYIEDPLVHDRVSTRFFTEATGAMEDLMARANSFTMPILVMQSGADKLVDPAGAKEFYDKIGSKDKTFKVWDGYYHEMFNEIAESRVPVFRLVEEWLSKRFPS